MLQAISNKTWRQHPTKWQLYGHRPPISKTNKIRRRRHAEHCWRSKNELISDVLPWISSNSRAKIGQPTRTYLQRLCTDTGWRLGELSEMMDDRVEWRKWVVSFFRLFLFLDGFFFLFFFLWIVSIFEWFDFFFFLMVSIFEDCFLLF